MSSPVLIDTPLQQEEMAFPISRLRPREGQDQDGFLLMDEIALREDSSVWYRLR